MVGVGWKGTMEFNQPTMKRLPLTNPSERIIGFTVPDEARFFFCGHDNVWMVAIEDAVAVTEIGHEPYEFVETSTSFVGLGDNNNEVRRVGDVAIGYDFDARQDSVVVRYDAGGRKGEINFPILSGDWFAASLSRSGKYLVLAEPYNLALFAVA